jgi:CDP-paratose 2-epimerase
MPKILITGGAGFTGVNAAARYLASGWDVAVFDNLSRPGALDNLTWLQEHEQADRLQMLIGDVRLPSKELRSVVERSDLVLHLAGQVAVTTSVVEPRADFDINALGTFNMLELIRTSQGAKPALFFSSTNKVYGGMETVATVEEEDRYRYGHLPLGISEDQPLDFHSPYGCSKGAADQYVRDYARIYDLATVVFRQSCIYGPRQFGVEDQGWVAWFVIAAILGRDITIYGNGKQVRDVLYIDDLLSAYERAWERLDDVAGGVYNVGGGPENTISLLDLLAQLGRELGSTIPVAYADWRPGDQPVYVSDIRRAGEELGWRPATGWQDGVNRLIEWVRKNKDLLNRVT